MSKTTRNQRRRAMKKNHQKMMRRIAQRCRAFMMDRDYNRDYDILLEIIAPTSGVDHVYEHRSDVNRMFRRIRDTLYDNVQAHVGKNHMLTNNKDLNINTLADR